jgi:protein SCO1/2
MRYPFTLPLLLCLLALSVPASAARTEAFDPSVALRASQAAVGQSVADFTLLDRAGRPVKLSSYRGKPLLVSFIYTGCFQVCPTTTRALQSAVKAAQDGWGTDQFNVISIGFNQPADSPPALRSFAAQHGIDYPNWEFLSPPAAIVADLTRDFGFSYVATPAGFDHILQITIVDAQGRIYRQIYGDNFSGNMLGEPLKQLISGAPVADRASLSSILARVRILCTVYDPVTGEYRLNNGLFLEIAGGLTFLLSVIWFFLIEWRKRKKSQHAA